MESSLVGRRGDETHNDGPGIAGALPGVRSVEKSDHRQRRTTRQELGYVDQHKSQSGTAVSSQRQRDQDQGVVKDGMVTLKGMAASQAQKDLTTEYAKNIAGVKGVQNEIIASRAGNNRQNTGRKDS